MATTINFKRGDTFAFTCTVTGISDITTWTIASDIKRANGVKLVSLVYAQTGATTYTLTYASSTSAWPIETLTWDIKYTSPGGNICHTETITVPIESEVTA